MAGTIHKGVKVFKRIFLLGICLSAFAGNGKAQAVIASEVVTVDVYLNSILRLTIINGGNIEFAFKTMTDYDLGIAASSFYVSNFTIASSQKWKLEYGSEDAASLLGMDDNTHTLGIRNVGFDLDENGTYNFGTQFKSDPTVDGVDISGLEPFPVTLIEDNADVLNPNAGDGTDNSFIINWRCGTREGQAGAAPVKMLNSTILDLATSPYPDRYITNVIFQLSAM